MSDIFESKARFFVNQHSSYDDYPNYTARWIMSFLAALFTASALFISSGCSSGGGGNDNSALPSNIGGGYTLVVSGGTLNDGSGANGLSVLATLRDSSGNGPAMPWTLTITGPGLGAPLTVSYDDGSPSSYMTSWWESSHPQSGTFTATATNGGTALTYKFTIDASKNLSQPVPSKSTNTISWNSITGAGSYYYKVTDGTGLLVISGYIASDPLLFSYSFNLPTLSNGSYLVEVFAQTTDRTALQNNASALPSLASQENMAVATMDFVIGGGYSLDARGGVLYEGVGTGAADQYGLVIWASILTAPTNSASSPTPPASDWNITVTGPAISTPITFTYPATDSQYIYWDFGTVPTAGTYTVSAIVSGGTTSLSQTFTVPSPTAKLPLAAVTANATNGGGASVSWDLVTGAKSYYVNIWTDVWDATLSQWVYTEIAGSWVNATSATIANNTMTKGIVYDVYVTACQQDMTDAATTPPAAPGAQVDMSDTTFTYVTITAQ